MGFVMLLPDSFRIANRKLYPARVSVLVSVRFVIPCSWLHFDALLQTAKPVGLQENASCCAQVRARSMRTQSLVCLNRNADKLRQRLPMPWMRAASADVPRIAGRCAYG